MKKTLVALLLVSTVIAMSMPGMADPRINIDKTVDLAQSSANTATSAVTQTLDNSGAQSNSAVVIALGGNAGAFSLANAGGSATNSGDAKIMKDGKNPKVNAGNTHSGNAAAASTATAVGGEGENGDVYQANTVAQGALALVLTGQAVLQNISETEVLIPVVDVDRSIFDNAMGSDNLIEIGCDTCDS